MLIPGRWSLPLLLVLLVQIQPVRAQIYTWTDAAGVRHYGDQPPEGGIADPLDLDRQSVSTIGGSGLREGERELLDRAEAARQAAARIEASRPPPPPAPVVIQTPAPVRERFVHTPSWWWWDQRRWQRSSWSFDLDLGRLSISGGQQDIRPPHRPPGHPSFRPPQHRPPPPRPERPSVRPLPYRSLPYGSGLTPPDGPGAQRSDRVAPHAGA